MHFNISESCAPFSWTSNLYNYFFITADKKLLLHFIYPYLTSLFSLESGKPTINSFSLLICQLFSPFSMPRFSGINTYCCQTFLRLSEHKQPKDGYTSLSPYSCCICPLTMCPWHEHQERGTEQVPKPQTTTEKKVLRHKKELVEKDGAWPAWVPGELPNFSAPCCPVGEVE